MRWRNRWSLIFFSFFFCLIFINFLTMYNGNGQYANYIFLGLHYCYLYFPRPTLLLFILSQTNIIVIYTFPDQHYCNYIFSDVHYCNYIFPGVPYYNYIFAGVPYYNYIFAGVQPEQGWALPLAARRQDSSSSKGFLPSWSPNSTYLHLDFYLFLFVNIQRKKT